MTLGQLQQSGIRYLAPGDLATASAATLQDLCSAINGAIADAYALAPFIHSTGRVSQTLPAPSIVRVTLAAGTNIVSGLDTPFPADWIGRTLSSGAFVTQITGTNSVLHDAFANSDSALVFGDAVPMPDAVVRLTGLPLWKSDRTTEGHYLQYADLSGDAFTPTTGEPVLFQAQPLGAIAGATVKGVLRIWPAPDSQGEITVAAQLAAPRYSLTDDPDTILPFHESWSEYVCAALAARLVTSPDWKNGELRSIVLDAAARAAATFRLMVPQTLAPEALSIMPYPQYGNTFLKL